MYLCTCAPAKADALVAVGERLTDSGLHCCSLQRGLHHGQQPRRLPLRFGGGLPTRRCTEGGDACNGGCFLGDLPWMAQLAAVAYMVDELRGCFAGRQMKEVRRRLVEYATSGGTAMAPSSPCSPASQLQVYTNGGDSPRQQRRRVASNDGAPGILAGRRSRRDAASGVERDVRLDDTGRRQPELARA